MVSRDLYRAARTRAAALDRSDRGRIVIGGADRATYLHGLLTNDIAALQPGLGCYAAYLTPQGRMISDLLVYELGDMILISLPGSTKDAVLARFDQFLFGEDVTLGDVTGTFRQRALIGPEAAGVLSGVLEQTPAGALEALPEHGNLRATIGGQPAIVTRITDTGEPGFDVYIEQDAADTVAARLIETGAAALDAETADAIRIEAGVPLFGHDMDEDTIPLEAGIESRAISFTKGCYVGQEVIIRVLHRGHGRVARRLVGMMLDGDAAPARGTVVTAGDRAVGTITSSAMSPALDRPIALGYLQRDFVAAGTEVSIGGARGAVTALPFVRAESRLAH